MDMRVYVYNMYERCIHIHTLFLNDILRNKHVVNYVDLTGELTYL